MTQQQISDDYSALSVGGVSIVYCFIGKWYGF